MYTVNSDQPEVALTAVRETRRQFLARGVIAGTLTLRVSGQGQGSRPVPGIEAGDPTRSLVIQGVTVIDGTGKPAMTGMTVVVSGNRIQSLGPTGKIVVPQGAQSIDARGKFLIPALWDMHSHTGGDISPLFIANGVTGARIMRGGPVQAKLRAEIAERKRPGPRLVVASPVLDGPANILNPDPPWRIVASPEQGRAAVRRATREGADFIKVYNSLSRDSYFAIADEAKKQRVPFVGHVPYQVTPAECSATGQKSIEHVFGIEMPYTAGYAAWRQTLIDAKSPADVPVLDLQTRVDTFSESRAAVLFPVLRKNHTWVCPTLTASRGLGGDPSLKQDPRLKYIPDTQKESWARIVDRFDLPLARRAHTIYLEIVNALYQAGVGILAGTDAPTQYCVPGFALHDELQLLVSAGLSPMDALRAATYKPAEFLGELHSLGTVEPGKLAELVLLEASPLDNISNTQKINMVFTGGRVYRKPALEAMLSTVEADARN